MKEKSHLGIKAVARIGALLLCGIAASVHANIKALLKSKANLHLRQHSNGCSYHADRYTYPYSVANAPTYGHAEPEADARTKPSPRICPAAALRD